MINRFEYSKGTSNKFWETEVGPTLKDGSVELYVRWGRIGTRGQSMTYTYPSAAHCLVERNRMIQGKVSKGYVLVTNTALSKAILGAAARSENEIPEHFDFVIKG